MLNPEQSSSTLSSLGNESYQDLLKSWKDIAALLQKSLRMDAFQRWFRNACLVSIQEGVASIAVPGEIHQVWIETNYLPEVQAAIHQVLPDVFKVLIVLQTNQAPAPLTTPNEETLPSSFISQKKGIPSADLLKKKIKSSGLNPSYTFQRFIIGANNQFAQAAADAVAQKKGVSYNPLFIHSKPGLGKTHLMHSIGQAWLEKNPNSKVTYITCEKFTNEFIEAIRKGDIDKFRRRYRHSDLMLIDDIQFIAGKERSQEEFFYTFNALLDHRCQVVLTSDRPASAIQSLEPRLISRFECGLTVEIEVPIMETRLAILNDKALQWKIKIAPSILHFLAEHITSNVRRLEGALMRVASYTSLAGEAVTIENIKKLLHDLLKEEVSKSINITTIQKNVAEYFEIKLSDMQSRKRPNSIAIPRQIAMYLSRSLTKGSLMEIGEAFGGRDHGTVMHACKKINEKMNQDSCFKDSVLRIEAQLQR